MLRAVEPLKQTVPLADYDPEGLLRFHHQMVLIRRFEEKVNEMYTRAKIGGYCHLNIGEEGSIVGSIGALEERDYLFTSYREHGHAIARGIAPRMVMAELFGKEAGVVHGRGGSMHLFDASRRFMGGWAIVGGHLPIAVGAGMAINHRGGDEVIVVFLGEGSTNIGAFHESLNAAQLWKLPILFIVVNNLYEMGTRVDEASAVPEQYKKALAYGIPSEQVDGMDVLAVHQATDRALKRTRTERRPSFLEFMAYRFRGHSVIDPARYRSEEEVKSWQERDPIQLLRHKLLDAKMITEEQVDALETEVETVVEEAVTYADASPSPDLSTLFDYLYAEEGGR